MPHTYIVYDEQEYSYELHIDDVVLLNVLNTFTEAYTLRSTLIDAIKTHEAIRDRDI